MKALLDRFGNATQLELTPEDLVEIFPVDAGRELFFYVTGHQVGKGMVLTLVAKNEQDESIKSKRLTSYD